jgi:hypothetical protein
MPATTTFFRPVALTALLKFGSCIALTMPERLIRSANAFGTISWSSDTSGPWMLSSMLEVSTSGMPTAVAIFARLKAFFLISST